MRDRFDQITDAEIETITSKGSLEGYDSFVVMLRNGEELEADIQVPNAALSRLVNAKGILQVGKRYLRYFYTHVASTEDVHLLPVLEEMKIEDRDPRFEYAMIEREHMPLGNVSRSIVDSRFMEVGYSDKPKLRINADLWWEDKVTNIIGANITIYEHFAYTRVRNQRLVGIVWWAREASVIISQISGTSTSDDLPFWGLPRTYTASNTNELNERFAFDTPSSLPNLKQAIDYDFTATNSLTDKKTGISSGSYQLFLKDPQ